MPAIPDIDDVTPAATVRSFVNTYEVHETHDRLRSPDDLWNWLAAAGLLDAPGGPPRVGRADLTLAHDLRAALRAMLRRRHEPQQPIRTSTAVPAVAPGPADLEEMPAHPRRPGAAAASLDRISRQLPLRVDLQPDGQPSLVPAVAGVRAGLARVLATVVSLPPGDWERLKVCPAGDCQWVFYDESRNRSRRWCSMEGCGNRSKVRSYRERAR